MPSLKEQVEELEKEVSKQFNQGEENERSEPVQTEGSKRGSSEIDEAGEEPPRTARVRGRDGRSDEPRGSGRRSARDNGARDGDAPEEAPQSVGKASSATGETSRQDSETSRKHGRGTSERYGEAPRSGGSPRSDAGRTDGRGSSDERGAGSSLTDKEDGAPADHVGAARLRRELREAKARLKELEESKAAPAQAATVSSDENKVVSDPEPNKAVDPQAWNEWRIRSLEKTIETKIAPIEKTYQQSEEQRIANERIGGAVNEFKQIRDEFIKKQPDFVPAFEHGYNKVAEAYALMNPTWSKEKIVKEADWQMLQFASDCARKGINPAEALYDLSIERFGYKPGMAKEAVEQPNRRRVVEQDDVDDEPIAQREKPRTDLRTIDRNRRRSVTPLSRGGAKWK